MSTHLHPGKDTLGDAAYNGHLPVLRDGLLAQPDMMRRAPEFLTKALAGCAANPRFYFAQASLWQRRQMLFDIARMLVDQGLQLDPKQHDPENAELLKNLFTESEKEEPLLHRYLTSVAKQQYDAHAFERYNAAQTARETYLTPNDDALYAEEISGGRHTLTDALICHEGRIVEPERAVTRAGGALGA